MLPEHPVRIAYVVPMTGSAGLFGPSCEACGQLAVDDVQAAGGILGRPVELIPVDGGRAPHEVAREVAGLWRSGIISAIAGWHISAVRKEILRLVGGQLPYVYAALHEGEFRTPGLFMVGESPVAQVLPAMDWFHVNFGARRWCIVGNDYIWPRQLSSRAIAHLSAGPAAHLGSVFVPMGTRAFDDVYRWVERVNADAVLVLLVGDDAIHFGRGFARHGLDPDVLRFSPILDENQVLGMGAAATGNMFGAAGYFDSLLTSTAAEFGARYYRAHGADAPVLNSIGQSCYESIMLLADITRRAGTFSVPDLDAAAVGAVVESPRGRSRMAGNCLQQDIYLASARSLELDVVERIHAI